MSLTDDQINEIENSRTFTDPNIARLVMLLITEFRALRETNLIDHEWCNQMVTLRERELDHLREGLAQVEHHDPETCDDPDPRDGRCCQRIAAKYLGAPPPQSA